MGCSGSKDGVGCGGGATGFLRKKSGKTMMASPVVGPAEKEVGREETVVAAVTAVVEVKRVSNDSMEQYFSPRKDEVAAGCGSEGLEYFSPGHELSNSSATATAPESGGDGGAPEAEEKEGGGEVKEGAEAGKSSNVAKETEANVAVEEKKKKGEIETQIVHESPAQ